MTNRTNDSLIDQIVAQVLSHLRERSGSVINSTNGKPVSRSIAAQSDQHSVVELPDAVITEELLKSQARPGTTIRIGGKAILTPTARDYIKSHDITIDRNQTATTAKNAGWGVFQGTIIASHLTETVQALLAEVKKQWKSSWTVEIEAGFSEVVAKASSVICRGESRQALVFAKAPHQLACLVNRNRDCRAAVVRSAADVQIVREEMQANVLCVDLRQPTYIGLRGILKACMETAGLIEDKERSQ